MYHLILSSCVRVRLYKVNHFPLFAEMFSPSQFSDFIIKFVVLVVQEWRMWPFRRNLRVVKGIFVTRDRPFFLPVKCEMVYFFLVNRDFHTSREAWFCKIIFRETRNKCLIRREAWNAYFIIFRELWKDRFIFRETWSRPPLYHPHPTYLIGMWNLGGFWN